MSGESDFDVDLEAGAEDPGTPLVTTPETPAAATPAAAASSEIEVGGRKYPSLEELKKAHLNMEKMSSRNANLAKRAEKWLKFEQELQSHPELATTINKQIAEYQARLNAGQSPATAQKATGIDPAMAQELKSMRDELWDLKIEKEIQALKAKYNVDDETVKEVVDVARARKGIPFEEAYFIAQGPKLQSQARTEAEKKYAAEKAKQAASGTATPAVPSVTPTPKDVTSMNEEEFGAHMKGVLKKFI